MYPSRFRYEAPRSLDEAIGLMHDGGDYVKVLAGGQSLVPLMKLRFASPELVVDINNVPGLNYHRADPDGSLRIGALCRHADLERSDLLKTTQPTMAAAAPLIADPIVRNRGTLVGSLCHADPQGDWASVVLALGGSVVARGPRGTRTIPLADFVTGPFQNVLDPDEIVVEAVIPAAKGIRSGGYLKLERRVGDFATVGVAVAIETSGENVTRAGIALTGVGGSTIAATAAAEALTGRPLTSDTIGQAAELAAQVARPRTDHRGSAEYKRHMVRTFVLRLLSRTDAAPDRRKGQPDHDDDRLRRPRRPVHGRDPGTPDQVHRQRREEDRRGGAAAAAGPPDPPRARPDRHAHGLRHDQLRRVHGPGRRPAGEVLHHAGRPGRRARDQHGRGPGHRQRAAPAAGRLQGGARAAVRVLHAGHDDGREGAARRESRPDRGRRALGAVGQSLPLHRLPEHREIGAVGGREA